MKYRFLYFPLFLCSSLAVISLHAASNNGYTSGANVYTGSTSTGWYGGGVAYVLAEWRKEGDLPETTEHVAESVEAPEAEAELVDEGETSESETSSVSTVGASSSEENQ